MNQQLTALINTSFIPDSDKENLVARLRSGAGESGVAEAFNQSLLDEFERLKQARDRAVSSFDAATALLEAEHNAARDRLSADINRALAKLRPTDFAARKQVWEDFDVAVEAQEKSHQNRLRQMLANAVLPTTPPSP